MGDQPTDTSDHQRFDEMFAHLTPLGASVPYNVVFDPEGNLWVASKGGLFKFDSNSRQVLFKRKNAFPNKMAAFCQVCCHDNTIIFTNAENKDRTTELVFLDLNGEEKHQQFVDGLIQSLVVNSEGEIYITKQLSGEESAIWWTTMDAPLGWEELLSTSEYAFQALGIMDDSTLIVATVQLPMNMYSKQSLRFVSIPGARVKKTFSEVGKEPGKIFFPRAMRRHGEHIVVLDKTGRFQRFTPAGEYFDTIAEVDAFLANGFTLCPPSLEKEEGQASAMAVCSGVVRDRANQAICDDWLEIIPFDGSSWREKRRAATAQANA